MFEIVSVRIHPGKQNGIKSRELVTQMKKTWETYRLGAWETTLSPKLKKHLGEAELPGLRSWGHLPKAANTGPTQKKLEPWRWSRRGRIQRGYTRQQERKRLVLSLLLPTGAWIMKPAEDSSPSASWHRGGQKVVMNESDGMRQNTTFGD